MQDKSEDWLVRRLVAISGEENVIVAGPAMADYGHDMADFEARPAVVVRPGSEREVTEIVTLAKEEHLHVLPRGAGSSLTGSAVSEGAIVLDMRRMDKVVKVDTVNWFVQVQPGITLEELNKRLFEFGFFFPPDPASSMVTTVGGAIAQGSGGLRCVRFGTMKEWVLALRVVLANGRAVRFGEPLVKNRAGYDLVHLLVGSEGTLGVVTEAWLKIAPLQTGKTLRFLVTFDSWEAAGDVIKRLRSSKILPHVFEFIDGETMRAVNRKLGTSYTESEATLLVDVEVAEGELAQGIFRDCGARTVRLARDEAEAASFYRARTVVYLALKDLSSGIQVEDVSVPIDRLGEFLKLVKQVASEYGVRMPTNGHAGDGNVHPIVLFDKSDPKSRAAASMAYEELCRKAIEMGGSVTGEHGIGSQKAKLLREQLEAHGGGEALVLMKEIKKVFDPDGIMNPGKYVEAA